MDKIDSKHLKKLNIALEDKTVALSMYIRRCMKPYEVNIRYTIKNKHADRTTVTMV